MNLQVSMMILRVTLMASRGTSFQKHLLIQKRGFQMLTVNSVRLSPMTSKINIIMHVHV